MGVCLKTYSRPWVTTMSAERIFFFFSSHAHAQAQILSALCQARLEKSGRFFVSFFHTRQQTRKPAEASAAGSSREESGWSQAFDQLLEEAEVSSCGGHSPSVLLKSISHESSRTLLEKQPDYWFSEYYWCCLLKLFSIFVIQLFGLCSYRYIFSLNTVFLIFWVKPGGGSHCLLYLFLCWFNWICNISLDNKYDAKKMTNGHFLFLGFSPWSKYTVWSPVMELGIQLIISVSLSKSWTPSIHPSNGSNTCRQSAVFLVEELKEGVLNYLPCGKGYTIKVWEF